MPNPNPKSFSFAPCVPFWEDQRGLCKLAVQRKPLLKEVDDKPVVHPSLANIRKNYLLLKGYTQTMKASGVILTNRIPYSLTPINNFYETMDPEMDTKLDGPKTVIYATASAFKKMLTIIKAKWRKWELPRAAGTNHNILGFV